jgi:endonuclease/exonuclease/phosphatase family metal-dependent hydrolase
MIDLTYTPDKSNKINRVLMRHHKHATRRKSRVIVTKLKHPKLTRKHLTHPLLIAALVISLFAGIGSYIVTNSKAADTHTPFQYKVASYNLLGAGAIAAPDFDKAHHVNTRDRMKNATSLMRNFDIVGVQELDYYKEGRFDKNQFEMFKDELQSTYNMYPKTSPVSTKKTLNFDKESMRAIFWKQDRFDLVDKGSIAYPYQDAPRKANGGFELNDRAPWVLLQDKDNPAVKFYFVNMHMIAYNTSNCRWDCNPPNEKGGSDSAGDQKRKEAAQILRDWIKEKKQKYPVLLTGDFNSSFTLRKDNDNRGRSVVERSTGLPYCVLTNDGVIRNTRDVYLNRAGSCPTNNPKEWFIDHVYATQEFNVENWAKLTSNIAAKASDHRPTYARVTLTPPQTDPSKSQQSTNTGTPINTPSVQTYENDSLDLLDD